MITYKDTLIQLTQNLNILREREARYGGNEPLDLLNQLTDHEQAIVLTEQADRGEITEAEWCEAMRPLLVNIHDRSERQPEICAVTIGDVEGGIIGSIIAGRDITAGGDIVTGTQMHQTATGSNIAQATQGGIATVNVNTTIRQTPEEPPFWQRLSRLNIILAIIFGFVMTTAAVLAVPGVSGYVYSLVAPRPFAPATDDETLIVIATFHETGATKTEPHIKIRRAIEEAAQKVGLTNLRVEVAPTELPADQREEAEALGKSYNAGIVIWGEDTGVQVLVNFLNLKQPDFDAAEVTINETERTQYRSQTTNPDAYQDFILTDLPGQLTFLSFFAVGQSFYQAKNYSQAKDVIEQGIALLPSDTQLNGLADAYFRLGWLYQGPLGDLISAIADYNKAIKLDPKSALTYNNRGAALADQGDLTAAIADYNKAIELDPKSALTYNNRGAALADQGDLTAAVADFTKAIELDPEDTTAYNNRGAALATQGSLTAAIADYTQAIKLEPKFAAIYTNRGFALAAQGNLTAAIADYNKAIELDPKFALAYTNRGLALAAQGNLTAAIADYNKAIELDPKFALAYTNRGTALAAQGNLTAAIADYNKAIELDPKFALAYTNRGFALAAQGNLTAAIADYDKAIELDPKFTAAYYNRGLALAAQGNLTAAIADYNKAIELDPKFALAYYSIACAYALQSEIEVALPPLRRALEIDPKNLLPLIPTDSNFNPIRDDPRFKALLAEFTPKK